MHLWRHKNGVWYVLFGPEGRRRISTRAKDRGRAETFLAQFIAGSLNPVPSDPTVGEILEAYKQDREPEVRSKQTLRFCVFVLQKHFDRLQPGHLNPVTIRKYAKDRGCTAGAILREIGVLRAALAWGIEHGWIAQAPKISNPVKTPPPRDRWITKDEGRRLLAACTEPHVRLFVLLALSTGARMSAILEARWDQVDFERRTINYGQGHGNKRRAVVPLNDEALEALRAAKTLAASPFIVEWRGKRMKTIKTGFNRACERAGLKDVSPHILRHSAATWMAIDGVPLAEIARMLGDQQATVERVYAKHSPDYLRPAAASLQLNSGA